MIQCEFQAALNHLRGGECDDGTEKYFSALSRDLATNEDQEVPLHIYFKKLPVDIHNQDVLSRLPGPLLTFESRDSRKVARKFCRQGVVPMLSLLQCYFLTSIST